MYTFLIKHCTDFLPLKTTLKNKGAVVLLLVVVVIIVIVVALVIIVVVVVSTWSCISSMWPVLVGTERSVGRRLFEGG